MNVKNRILIILVILIMLSMTIGVTPAQAWDRKAHCSPGFWKNRAVKVIRGYGTIQDDIFDWGYTYWEALRVRGPGSDFIRHAAADRLNSRFIWADAYCMD